MSKYIFRLDDASEKMDIDKWNRMETLLDRFGVKPLVGVIPCCKDKMMEKYPVDVMFWDKVYRWSQKDWTIALHGYEHVYCTKEGGINPVNNRSEFAGLPLEEQRAKIRSGVGIFSQHGLTPKVFFAPSHTFDLNTIEAIKKESDIRIISDTVADSPYTEYGITFIPQQSGMVRRLPFSLVTFCYHPNDMTEKMFSDLEQFLKKNKEKFIEFPLTCTDRKYGIVDMMLKKMYFMRR